ncbi:MAG: carboxypeptidase-like regulatory domain-containing protein, partial [Bacteroidales bacterium]
MRKLTLILTFLLFAGLTASAQMQITGTVTNAETGEPIPGVSIVVQSQTTIGTTTDMDGSYSLEVPSDAETLVFSFVGMQTQEVPINGRTT